MYCPKCGKENPEKQRFCTSCGLKLESISLVLTEEAATVVVDFNAPRDGKSGRLDVRQRLEHGDPLTYAFVIIAAGVAIGAIGYKVLAEKTLGDIGTLVALVGILVILLKGISLVIASSGATTRSQTLTEGERDDPARAPIQYKGTAGLLTGEPASVTEHTTRQLESSPGNDPERPRTTQPT